APGRGGAGGAAAAAGAGAGNSRAGRSWFVLRTEARAALPRRGALRRRQRLGGVEAHLLAEPPRGTVELAQRLQGGGRQLVLDDEVERPDFEAVAGTDDLEAGEAVAVEARAVGAVQVLGDDEARFDAVQPAVRAADAPRGEAYRRAAAAPQRHDPLRQRQD